jgi:hypothetical protein
MENGVVCERLLLAFAPKLQKSKNAQDQRGILDEEASPERPSRLGGRQAPEKVRLAMRGDLGVPSKGSCQTG